jgi:hypothetical protein
VVVDPESSRRVLVVARWPGRRPQQRALLELETEDGGSRARELLIAWCNGHASISPVADSEGTVILRRRRSKEQLRAHLIGEHTAPN